MVDGTVAPLDELTNTATLLNYAGAEGAGNHVAAGLSPRATDDATVVVRDMVIDKVLTSTNQAHTSDPNVAIGEIATYTVTLTVPEGKTPNAVYADTLDAGLALVDVVSITPSSGALTTSKVTWTAVLATLTVTDQGKRFTLDFGTLTNANRVDTTAETIEIVYRVVVLNTVDNQAGQDLTNDATLSWDGGEVSDSAAALNVVEPVLTIAKSAAPITGDAGDEITFTILITNTNPANSAAAFNVSLSDTIPSGLTFKTGSLQHTGGVLPTSGTLIESAGVISAQYAVLAVGDTSTIEFVATLDGTVTPGQVLTNSATTRWTSLPGAPGQLSTHNSLSYERTGNTADPGTTANDYRASDDATVTINQPVPTKEILSTNQGHTLDREVAIGEKITYSTAITLTEGVTPNLSLVDTLQAGLAFVSIDAVRTSSGDLTRASGTFEDVRTGALIENSGQRATLTFGAVTNVNSDNNSSETITVDYTVVVLNVSGNNAGNTRTNSAVWSWTGNSATVVAPAVTIVEPVLNIAKTATPAVVDYDNEITYTLVISNVTGAHDADAFDLLVTDTVPTGTSYVAGSLTTSSGVAYSSSAMNGAQLEVRYNRLDVGQTSTLQFRVKVLIGAVPSTTIPNLVNLTWTSLPGDAATVFSSYNPSSVERNGTGTTPGADNDYEDDAPASVTVKAPTFTKSLTTTDQTFTSGNNVAIGEIVTYTIVVTVPEGTSPSATVTDDLEAGLALVAVDSITLSNGGAWMTGGTPNPTAAVTVDRA